ncbi:MAG: endonuclease/exonuclease/phosphatase family protein [Candidatus Dormibacteraeota bacterium]|nr:endonuclease/exonuclease/phosphatase family protein [Candidatus Dormibacteraeota bacterium]
MRSRTRKHATVRVATYNILWGGARRERLIHDVLRRIDADVVALQEVCDVDMVRTLARKLHMDVMLGEPSDPTSFHVAILSRLPVRKWRNRRHEGRMLRSHLHAEIDTGGSETPVFGVHCVHLAARFGERAKGEARRMRELTAVLGGIDAEPALPHVLAGDFNSLSPGDGVAATAFFRRYNALRRAGLVVEREAGYIGPKPRGAGDDDSKLDARWRAAGVDPRLDVGVPYLPRVAGRLTNGLPVSPALDRFLGRFIERWTAERIAARGYVDCYRARHPRAHGYTCATWLPAARVDYVFATPDLARHLAHCDVVGARGHADPDVAVASDHFPVVAEFDV